MIDLPYLSIIKVTDADAGSFLHAQLSADIASLAEGQSCFATYCNPQGQVVALLLVCRSGNEFLLISEASLAEAVVKRLGMYVLRARVGLTPLSGSHAVGLSPGDAVHPETLVLAPRGMSLRYGLVAGIAGDNPDSGQWRTEEIIRGIAWLQPPTSGRFLPQMLGLDRIGAVSFRKGCYPGQEIIARTRYLGNLKRFPVCLRIDGRPEVGAGDGCVLHSAGRAIDAVVVETASSAGEATLLAVAPLAPGESVDLLETGKDSWAALRLELGASGQDQA